jgi:indolepyruvate ferredoxin oxidoreductase
VSFAVLPDMVRGYEDIKLRNAERYAAAIVALGLPAPDGLAS